MPYMLLIVEPLEQRAERGEAEGRAVYQRMLDYTADLQERGLLMNSSSLAHPREGLRLQLRDGRRSVVDGPFAESKEMVGGFFLVNVATQAEALALAAACPAAEWATIELRATGPCYESA